jgi:nucleoside-diphosphate-sugar epimerase/glycosyltransferase involved in cell wall biosynthesis
MKRVLFGDTWTEEERKEALALKGPIIIIGASGFIGAKLFFSLIQLRSDVYAASRSINSSWRLLKLPPEAKPHNFLNLDITHYNALLEQLQRLKPRTVFNLSAYGSYERQNDPDQIHKVNYLGTLNIIKALQDLGCDAFVQAGSSSEYGLNCAGPVESATLMPNSDYSVAKGAASLAIAFYGKIKSLPYVNLRLYSIYGPFEEKERLIPKLVVSGINGKLPPFADGSISRDFVYVDDCTNAFVKAALTACVTDPGLSINIGTGKKTTLAEVANAAKQIFDIREEPQFGSMKNRKWDLSNWYADAALAREKLGWAAKTSFQDGLQLTKEWETEASKQLNFNPSPIIQKKISAIVACYRDHQAIPVMYRRLSDTFAKLGVDYEIIFVNDRSPATDEDEIQRLCLVDHHVVGISHSRNFGSQSAFLSGMGVATGDSVVLLDGDLQDPPELISAFYEKWQEGFDVVYGIRVKREAAFYMQIFYKIFYRVFRTLSEIEIPVDAGDFSLIDRKVVSQLSQLPEKDVFLRGLRAWVGYKQTGVPYVRPERMFGKTTNSFFKNIWWAKKAVFSFSLKPLAYIQSIGALAFGLSVLMSITYIFFYFFNPQGAPRGITTIIVLALGMGGLQLLSISVLGDYLGKVLEEVKNRPRFIRAKILRGKEVYDSEEKIRGFLESLKQ